MNAAPIFIVGGTAYARPDGVLGPAIGPCHVGFRTLSALARFRVLNINNNNNNLIANYNNPLY